MFPFKVQSETFSTYKEARIYKHWLMANGYKCVTMTEQNNQHVVSFVGAIN